MKKERVKVMKGKIVSLVVPEKEDVELWYKWINNPEINKYLFAWEEPLSLEYEEGVYNKQAEKMTMLSIYLNDEKKVIGNVGWKWISHFHKKTSIWLFIWETANHSKWYWTETMRLLLDYMFKFQWMRKVSLSVYSWNEKWINLYKKVWFKEIWLKKKHLYKQWEYVDVILMEIFEDEFYKANKDYFNKK